MTAHRVNFDLAQADLSIPDPGNAGNIVCDRTPSYCPIVTTGAETRTVPRAIAAGLILVVEMQTDGGDCTVTVTGGYNQAGTTTFVLDDVKDAVLLWSINNGTTIDWVRLGSNGVANADAVTLNGAVVLGSTLAVAGVTTPTGGIAAAAGSSATPCGQIHTGGYPAIISTSGTELTPAAGTTAYICEIFIPCNMTIVGVNHFNGSVVTGNITVGLYTAAGVAIAAAVSAATAGSGTDQYQAIPFATPYAAIGPAKYLLAFLYSNTAARPNTHHVGTVFSLSQATFTVGTTAVSPLPTAFVADNCPMASLY